MKEFKLLMAFLLFFSSFSFASDFKQGYIPIINNGITIIIPVDLRPAMLGEISIDLQSKSQLHWLPVKDADYYQIERFSGGNWFALSSYHLNNYFVDERQELKLKSKDYRIRACNSFGCSDWQNNLKAVSEDIFVNAFYSSSTKVSAGQLVTLNWSVNGAHTITIKNANGSVYKTTKSESDKITLTANQSGTYVLTASSFYNKSVSTSLVVEVEQNHSTSDSYRSDFTQLLHNIDYYVNYNTVLTFDDKAFFGTHDGKLVHFKRMAGTSSVTKWHFIWEKQLKGTIHNPPSVNGNHIYYSLNMFGGRSQVCAIDINKTPVQDCSPVKLRRLYASPIIIDSNLLPNSHLSWLQRNGYTPIENRVLEGIYIFYAAGHVEVLDINNLSRVIGVFGFDRTLNNAILRTPEIFVGAPNSASEGLLQFAVKDGNELKGLHAPLKSAGDSLYERVRVFLGFPTKQSTPSKNMQLPQIKQAWSTTL